MITILANYQLRITTQDLKIFINRLKFFGEQLRQTTDQQVINMGPKKQIKKEVIQQPPKEVIPQIPPHELAGYGRFDYPGGAFYEGNWRLFKGIKLKHGQGTLTVQNIASSAIGKELYEGEWQEDQMKGKGTYYYPDGSVYKGEWKDSKHHGKGVYEFANGTVYEGEWENNLLHGTGYYIDATGRKWQGEFRKGIFESKRQAQLVKEKGIRIKKQQIHKQVAATFQNILDAISKSDKKTLKENLTPFFALNDNAKEFIKDPYAKFDERPPEKWTQFINTIKGGDYRILSNNSEATIIAPERILGKQLSGNGQFVEVLAVKDDKTFKIGLVGLEGKKWIVIVAIEQEKKK